MNKGISGEGVSQMVSRFERDVPAHRPQAARVDVVRMDPRFAPRVRAQPVHPRVVDAIGAAARDMKVVSTGQHRMDELVTDDGLHLTDVGYVSAVLSSTQNRLPSAGADSTPTRPPSRAIPL
jgi:hypothetical protein